MAYQPLMTIQCQILFIRIYSYHLWTLSEYHISNFFFKMLFIAYKPLYNIGYCYFIIIIIIIMLCWQHGYPWPSLATFPYRSSPQAGLLDNIPYPHIVAECMFVLVVLLLHDRVWGSTRVHHLWAHPSFSSSVLHVWFV